MIQIRKAKEPNSLVEERADGGRYATYPDKDTLRTSLYTEQKAICCYCMGRIHDDSLKMKIEHFRSQADHTKEQLDYSNLLGACLGNQGKPPTEQHCDTKKASQALCKNPASDPDVALTISYGTDGKIASTDPTLNGQLTTVLNLNLSIHVTARKAVLEGFRKGGDSRTWTKKQVERWLAEWAGSNGATELRPYCGVAVYWLKKRLAQFR